MVRLFQKVMPSSSSSSSRYESVVLIDDKNPPVTTSTTLKTTTTTTEMNISNLGDKNSTNVTSTSDRGSLLLSTKSGSVDQLSAISISK